jgi:hypothetical protein
VGSAPAGFVQKFRYSQMADYYPSIAQAVNGLEVNTVVTRRSIYDRARAAMVAQLRGLAPALSEAAIERELSALEEAIRKTEAENLRRSRTPAPPPPARQPDPPRMPIRQFDSPPPAPVRDTSDEPEIRFPRNPSPSWAARAHSHILRPGPVVPPRSSPPPRNPAPPRSPVEPRSFMREATTPAATWSPRPRRKFAALTITGLVVFAAAAATGVFMGPEIMAALRGLTNSDEAAEIPARGNAGAPPKIAERIAFTPAALPSTKINPLVAQKVMLYEEDAAEPAGRSFGGSADWRTESISPSAGQSPTVALRADIEIPDQHIGVRWTLRNNDDAAMPASHTMEIMFTLPPDFSHGGISRIPAVLMKQAEAAPGVPLAGLGVKVSSNIFLISLSSAEADAQRNVQLLRERPWLDIPIVYDDGRRAILAVEKGSAGDRAFSDAFAAWELANR